MASNAEPPRSENSAQTWECLPATSHSVDQIAFSSDGKILASYYGKSAETVKLWDVASGQQLYAAKWVNLQELAGGDEGLDFLGCKSLFFSSDGKTLIFDHFIFDLELGQVINVRTLNSPFKLEHHRGIAVSTDLQIAVTAYSGYRRDENNVGTMKLWETSTGKEIYTLFLGRNVNDWDIYVNQFSPDGKIFASLIWFRHGSDFYPDGYHEEKIKLWEVKTGMELCSIPLPKVIG